MQIPFIVIFLGLLIFLSHVFNGLFEKTKIPNVLLLLLTGVIIGPIGGWVKPEFFGEMGSVFTTITLIVIMFESGINLKFAQIKKAIGAAMILTIVNFVGSAVIAVLVVNIFTGLDMLGSIFIGTIIGGTSSAVVIPMVKQLRIEEKNETVLLLESAVSDVLCLVVGLAVLGGMRSGQIDIGGVFSTMWKAFLFAALIGLVTGFVWSVLLNLIRGLQNSIFINLAFAFVVYGVVELVGFNGGIATLTFGILLGNNDFLNKSKVVRKVFAKGSNTFNEIERNFFSEIVFVLQTYFFVYIGVNIQFGNVGHLIIGFVIVVGIILIRPFGIKLVTRKSTKIRDIAIMSVMTPKGLVVAVLASLPLQVGLAGGDIIMNIGFAIVLFSILLCSLLIIILNKDPLIFTRVYGGKPTEPLPADASSNLPDVSIQDEKEEIVPRDNNSKLQEDRGL